MKADWFSDYALPLPVKENILRVRKEHGKYFRKKLKETGCSPKDIKSNFTGKEFNKVLWGNNISDKLVNL